MLEAHYFFPLVFLLSASLVAISIKLALTYVFSKQRFECPATSPSFGFLVSGSQQFEIAIKRPYLQGVIPFNTRFEIRSPNEGKLSVMHRVSISEQRRDFSGNRIVPVAQFHAKGSGEHTLINQNMDKLNPNDVIMIGPKNPIKAIVIILGLVISAFLAVGSLILSVMFWIGLI